MGKKLDQPLTITADEVQIAELLISMPPETNDVMIGVALAYGFRDADGKWTTMKVERMAFPLNRRDPATGNVIEDADVKNLVTQHYDTIKTAIYDLLTKKGVL